MDEGFFRFFGSDVNFFCRTNFIRFRLDKVSRFRLGEFYLLLFLFFCYYFYDRFY